MRTLLAAIFVLFAVGMASAESPQKQYVDNYVTVASKLFGMEPDVTISDNYCHHDSFCEVMFDNFKIQAQFHGPYQSSVLTSSQISPEAYLLACAALLSGVAEIESNKAIATVIAAFQFASEKGSAEHMFGEAKLTVTPQLDGQLGCEMYRPS